MRGFIFVVNASNMVAVASSNFPGLAGRVAPDLPPTDYPREGLILHLALCDGLWMLYELAPEPDVTITGIPWLSELGGYIPGSGFYPPDPDLPAWRPSRCGGQLGTMVRMINAGADAGARTRG